MYSQLVCARVTKKHTVLHIPHKHVCPILISTIATILIYHSYMHHLFSNCHKVRLHFVHPHPWLNPNFPIADGDNLYWSAQPVKTNPTEIINTVPQMSPREFPSAHECKAVQATAFALMVYIQNNRFTDSRPIMLWLQTMRNYDGGFATSQVCPIDNNISNTDNDNERLLGFITIV